MRIMLPCEDLENWMLEMYLAIVCRFTISDGVMEALLELPVMPPLVVKVPEAGCTRI